MLTRLGFTNRPEPTPEALRAVYAAWCQRVPFDNARKLIHVRSGAAGPLPGSTAEDYFEGWLKFGTGGTCWAGAGALYALLASLGFAAERGVGTMLVAPNLPPNHGTVRVRFDGMHRLVDTSILHGEPLRLHEAGESRVEHAAWGVCCGQRDGRWHIGWRPLHRLDGFECRLEGFGVAREEFERRHEETRPWSPFNYELTARLNRGGSVVGIVSGHRVGLHGDGTVEHVPVTEPERKRLLVDELGLSEELVDRLPPDVPTPPPPGSHTAAALSKETSTP